MSDKNLKLLCEENPRITNIYIHNTPNDILKKEHYSNHGNAYIIFENDEITSCDNCGNVSMSGFVCNIPMYIESLKYNSCLNRKISIDVDGNIKNCPSMINTYGNINNIELSEVINTKDFTKLWNITKDKID
jgi:hypothetical protein